MPGQEIELPSRPAVGFDRVDVRPGGVLVPVRRPGVLAHLAAALQDAGDRDVVVMTVRLVGIDVSDDLSAQADPTGDERRLLIAAAVLAERYGHAVHLLIVPGRNVFDAVADAAAHLRSSDVYVGESETLSADAQARLLGDAWERASNHEPVDVRLVIHHRSGRTAVYRLGAHAPSLNTEDFHLIHALWLDAVKSIGPHVHHRDVVRAALTYMQEQLGKEGPSREAAIDLVRRTARPADELAAIVHQRDFVRLRDMVRNRPPRDMAGVLTDLSLEDQVVTFRVLPRKFAAATFEYLSHDAQQALLKAMAQEDVAAHPERHGARRSHDVPRGAAGGGHAAVACAAHAGRACRGGDAARVSRAFDRPPDDAALHRGARALDRAAGARLHSRARPGQRDAECHLRRRRPRCAHRRHSHSRVPAHAARQQGGGSDGPPLRRSQCGRRPGAPPSRCSAARTARRCP